MIDCRRRSSSAATLQTLGFYRSLHTPPYSCLVISMNICRRAPSLLRAKSDNSAANKAESEREPIQTSVYRKKNNNNNRKEKGKKKAKGVQLISATTASDNRQTIIWCRAERKKKNLFIHGLLNQFHRLKLIPVNNVIFNYKGWTYSLRQIVVPVHSPREQKTSFLCLVMMHFPATNQSSQRIHL